MTIRPVVIAVSALFMLALLTGLLWNPIRRVGYELAFKASTGAQLQIGSLREDAARTVLRGVRVTAASGDAVFTASRITIRRAAGRTELAIDDPQGTVQLGRDTLRRLRALRPGIAMLAAGATRISVTGGGLLVSRVDVQTAAPPAPLQLSGFTGTVSLGEGAPIIDATASLSDGAQSYPLTFTAGHLRAAALPAAPLWALLPPSAVSLTSGILHDVDVALDASGNGSVGVRNVDGAYDGHALHGLHGTLLLGSDGFATREIAGLVDRIPVQIAGEVHDVTNWNDAVRTGTPNLRALARVFGMISPTPGLRWMRLEATAPGIAFGQYGMQLAQLPRVVQLLTIDPHEKTLHFDTALSGDHLISHGERTTGMGVRTHAVAGLNGDYFDIARTYQPQGMFMRGGRLMRGPADRQALIIDRNNGVHFDEFHLHGQVQIGSLTLPVTQYNNWPLGLVTIVTPDFGKELPAASGTRFLALQYVRGDRYRVTAITKERVPSPLQFGIAIGPDIKNLTTPAIGDEIRLSYRIDPAVPHAIAAIGGGPLLLRGGQWFEDPHAPAPDERDVRWPVDALGVLSDGTLIMAAVDGRHPERSVGMTRPEFGKLLQDLGVTDAMAMDSGGSVTLVARSPGDTGVTLHNMPSDDSAERYVSNGIFVYSSAPAGSLLQGKAPTSILSSNER